MTSTCLRFHSLVSVFKLQKFVLLPRVTHVTGRAGLEDSGISEVLFFTTESFVCEA